MIIPSSLAYKYAFTFSARCRPYRGQCVFSKIQLFTVPLSDASAFRDFLKFVAKEVSQAAADDVQLRVDWSLRRDGWVFAVYDGRNFRFFGIPSIESSILFFRVFYTQFEGLDSFGFYDIYRPAPIGC